HDWYRLGCRFLVDQQKRDGSWQGAQRPSQFDHAPLVATTFSLLFLSKGRTPVLISKLAYGNRDSHGWNNKRNDVRNLVEYASRELFQKKPLAWQIFDVRQMDAGGEDAQSALAAELLASPVVWFNGHDLAPRDREEAILRNYLAGGGFVFAEVCCGS